MAAPSLTGITFAKQFPNPAEPVRGLFVSEQVAATSEHVAWRVIAPVPFVPRFLAGKLSRPYVRGSEVTAMGVPVAHPRYPVLPRRMLYSTVAPAVCAASRRDFDEAVKAVSPQFVHAHALYPSGAAARRLSRRSGLPLIVTIHGSDLYTNLVRPAWAAEVRATIDSCKALICVSRSLAADAVRLAGARPERTLVIPDTYDDECFSMVRRESPEGRRLRFISVGRLVDVKGFDVLLAALAEACADGLDAELTIVGEGPLRAGLGDRVVQLGIAERVRWAGALSPSALAKELATADAYVQPSLREGFGVALVEALATGMVAIATDSGGPGDIMTDVCGLLVSPNDVSALARALADARELVGRCDGAAIATQMQTRYSRVAVAARLVRLYREVASGATLSGSLAEEGAR